MKKILPFIFICISVAAYAEIEPNTDCTALSGNEVQDSSSRSLALPGRLSINSFSMYDNPARVTDSAGAFLDGHEKAGNTWGGVIIPFPFSITSGILLRRAEPESSPLRNCLVEPSTGRIGAFSTMIRSDMKLGTLDSTSEYFTSDTSFPNKSVSELATGNGTTRGFGNVDLFQGYRIWMLNIGLMESFSQSSQSLSDALSDGSSRSLRYSAAQKRFSAGISTAPIGFLESEFAFTYAKHSLSFDYDAKTTENYPVIKDQELRESLHCKSAENTEIGFFFRAIATINSKFKAFGTFHYSRYEMPVDVYGKSQTSAAGDAHTVRYTTSWEMTSFDCAIHQTTGENCTIIYSAGFTSLYQRWTKKTTVQPLSSDSSVWGTDVINDQRKTDILLIPVGVGAEYRVTEKITVRSGVRKYIWAPYTSSYSGVTGSAVTSSRTKGRYSSTDQFFAGSGCTLALTEAMHIDVDISVANSCLIQSQTKKTSVTGGVTVKYSF